MVVKRPGRNDVDASAGLFGMVYPDHGNPSHRRTWSAAHGPAGPRLGCRRGDRGCRCGVVAMNRRRRRWCRREPASAPARPRSIHHGSARLPALGYQTAVGLIASIGKSFGGHRQPMRLSCGEEFGSGQPDEDQPGIDLGHALRRWHRQAPGRVPPCCRAPRAVSRGRVGCLPPD